MAAEHYVTFLTSVADTQEGFDRLCGALLEIDAELTGAGGAAEKETERQTEVLHTSEETGRQSETLHTADTEPANEEVLSLEEAENREKRRLPLCESAGRVSGEYIYLYPPGIPLLIPGERITRRLLDRLDGCRRQGFELQGLTDYSGETILVIAEPEDGRGTSEQEAGKWEKYFI